MSTSLGIKKPFRHDYKPEMGVDANFVWVKLGKNGRFGSTYFSAKSTQFHFKRSWV
jgi:hypothetical protein